MNCHLLKMAHYNTHFTLYLHHRYNVALDSARAQAECAERRLGPMSIVHAVFAPEAVNRALCRKSGKLDMDVYAAYVERMLNTVLSSSNDYLFTYTVCHDSVNRYKNMHFHKGWYGREVAKITIHEDIYKYSKYELDEYYRDPEYRSQIRAVLRPACHPIFRELLCDDVAELAVMYI